MTEWVDPKVRLPVILEQQRNLRANWDLGQYLSPKVPNSRLPLISLRPEHWDTTLSGYIRRMWQKFEKVSSLTSEKVGL